MIAFQPDLRPALPNVYAASDYCEFRDQLTQIDRLLRVSGTENALVESAVLRWMSEAGRTEVMITSGMLQRERQMLHYALRCNVARHLMGEGFRPFSVRLADSTLLQWFTGISAFEHRKAASKSSLERYDKCFDPCEIEEAIRSMIRQVIDEQSVAAVLGREEAVSIEEIFADCTCVKAHIHFPVDWVLLRDSARTLVAAIKLIRAEGLKHRMPEPASLVKRMNRLCIEMTHARRRPDSKKVRKRVLRSMKRLSRTIESHAQRYRVLLAENRERTEWTEAEAALVLSRLDNVLTKLPHAIHQAHERIIGERRLDNSEKLLSLYDDDIHVLVRGKSGSEVEFGNGLYLAEQRDGLIVDWTLFKDRPPADTALVGKSVTRIKEAYGSIDVFCADRGFDSKANVNTLTSENVFNAICPRNPTLMAERATEPRFMQYQNRRAQTEARIAIFKNAYLGRPLRSKGFASKENTMLWCVLTHNLWVLARVVLAEEKEQAAAA
jgi:hypothetical protein